MMNKPKYWIIGYFLLVIGILAIIGIWTVKVDPFFHFHKPDTSEYFYDLNNQRSQNDGISKNFNYQGLITGTSMTENFKVSEAEAVYNCDFIKLPYSGGSYKEINDSIETALTHNNDLKMVIRGLDMAMFFDEKDRMRIELGTFPTYLYDDNIFNDVGYIFNRDVIFTRVYPMLKGNTESGIQGGITSFDEYSNWMKHYSFGIKTLYPDGIVMQEPAASTTLTQEERNTIAGNVQQNITALPQEYPDVTFYYFFTPYSAAWWKSLAEDGTLYKQIQAERIVIEEILKCDNIKLYSFNCLTDITTDLNNYKDTIHYGEWINSLILNYMYDEKFMLTEDNYEQYLSEELNFYSEYDYIQLNAQEDYINDYYAAALLNEEVNEVCPVSVDLENSEQIETSYAELISNQHNGKDGIVCLGSLQRTSGSDISVSDYLRDTEYRGFLYILEDISPYKYLVFYGKKVKDHGQPGVYLYDEKGRLVGECSVSYRDLDEEWHQYLIDVSQIKGKVSVIFNGGYVDNTGSSDSQYIFSDVTFY